LDKFVLLEVISANHRFPSRSVSNNHDLLKSSITIGANPLIWVLAPLNVPTYSFVKRISLNWVKYFIISRITSQSGKNNMLESYNKIIKKVLAFFLQKVKFIGEKMDTLDIVGGICAIAAMIQGLSQWTTSRQARGI
jgi:hypothetical protein